MTTTSASLSGIARVDLRGGRTSARLPRAELDVAAVTAMVAPLLEEVRLGGVDAVLELAERFDGVRPPGLRVPAGRLRAAAARGGWHQR